MKWVRLLTGKIIFRYFNIRKVLGVAAWAAMTRYPCSQLKPDKLK